MVRDPEVRAYVGWLPMLRDDTEERVAAAAALLPDPRVSHFWEGSGHLGREYARVLELNDDRPTLSIYFVLSWLYKQHLRMKGRSVNLPAWDVYLLFGRAAEWHDTPPVPHFWMHQLPIARLNRLRGGRLAAEVGKQLRA